MERKYFACIAPGRIDERRSLAAIQPEQRAHKKGKKKKE